MVHEIDGATPGAEVAIREALLEFRLVFGQTPGGEIARGKRLSAHLRGDHAGSHRQVHAFLGEAVGVAETGCVAGHQQAGPGQLGHHGNARLGQQVGRVFHHPSALQQRSHRV